MSPSNLLLTSGQIIVMNVIFICVENTQIDIFPHYPVRLLWATFIYYLICLNREYNAR